MAPPPPPSVLRVRQKTFFRGAARPNPHQPPPKARPGTVLVATANKKNVTKNGDKRQSRRKWGTGKAGATHPQQKLVDRKENRQNQSWVLKFFQKRSHKCNGNKPPKGKKVSLSDKPHREAPQKRTRVGGEIGHFTPGPRTQPRLGGGKTETQPIYIFFKSPLGVNPPFSEKNQTKERKEKKRKKRRRQCQKKTT